MMTPRLFSRLALLGLAAVAPVAASAAVETYQIDPAHSSVVFNVRHFFARVPGVFARFSGTMTVDRENFEHNTITATTDIGSLSTRQPDRDKHLLSADFFLAEKFPVATFTSKSWKKTGHDTYTVRGDLTIKDRTREIILEVRPLGFGPGNRGAMLSGWEAAFTIDRTDFDVGKSEKAIGDEVELVVNIEAKLQPAGPKAP